MKISCQNPHSLILLGPDYLEQLQAVYLTAIESISKDFLVTVKSRENSQRRRQGFSNLQNCL